MQCVTKSLVLLTASGERETNHMRVVLRIRPVAVKGAPRWNNHICIHATSKSSIAIVPPDGSQGYKNGERGQTYSFSQVFEHGTAQEQYYQATAAPLVEEVAKSNTLRTSVLMAYGITASGKTYTIEGTRSSPGVLPRALTHLFEELEKAGGDRSVFVSFYEVYNEQVHDLLAEDGAPGQKASLRIKEDVRGYIQIAGLSRVRIASTFEGLGLLRRGSRHRQRAGTTLNHRSSRSHSIFTIYVSGGSSSEDLPYVPPAEADTLGQISFVDLAGAERANRTGNAGARLKESVAINSSLMTLGRCLEALRWNQQHPNAEQRLVPYRESKVTHIFRDVLHGWGRLVLSVCVSPSSADFDETHNVLKYAQMATQISQLCRAAPAARPPPRSAARNCPGSVSKKQRLCHEGGAVDAGTSRRALRASLANGKVNAAELKRAGEAIEELEDTVLELRAHKSALEQQVHELSEQLEDAQEQAALAESRIRQEVAGEMSGLLAQMDAKYKEREAELRERLGEEPANRQCRRSAEGTLEDGSAERLLKELRARHSELSEELAAWKSRSESLQDVARALAQISPRKEDGDLDWIAVAAAAKERLTQIEANHAAEAHFLNDQIERQSQDNRRLRKRHKRALAGLAGQSPTDQRAGDDFESLLRSTELLSRVQEASGPQPLPSARKLMLPRDSPDSTAEGDSLASGLNSAGAESSPPTARVGGEGGSGRLLEALREGQPLPPEGTGPKRPPPPQEPRRASEDSPAHNGVGALPTFSSSETMPPLRRTDVCAGSGKKRTSQRFCGTEPSRCMDTDPAGSQELAEQGVAARGCPSRSAGMGGAQSDVGVDVASHAIDLSVDFCPAFAEHSALDAGGGAADVPRAEDAAARGPAESGRACSPSRAQGSGCPAPDQQEAPDEQRPDGACRGEGCAGGSSGSTGCVGRAGRGDRSTRRLTRLQRELSWSLDVDEDRFYTQGDDPAEQGSRREGEAGAARARRTSTAGRPSLRGAPRKALPRSRNKKNPRAGSVDKPAASSRQQDRRDQTQCLDPIEEESDDQKENWDGPLETAVSDCKAGRVHVPMKSPALLEWSKAQQRRKRRLGPTTALLSLSSNHQLD